MKAWWDSLAARERMITIAGASALLLILIYLLVLEPFAGKHKLLTNNIKADKELLVWMQQSSHKVKRLRRSPAATTTRNSNRSMLATIESSAKQAKLRAAIQRMEPDGNNGAKLWIENANFDSLMRWLDQLQRQHGISVSRSSIDKTGESGLVSSRLSLQR